MNSGKIQIDETSIEFEVAGDNLFEYLGMSDAEKRQEKLQLSMRIWEWINQNGRDTGDAAQISGIPHPDIEDIVRGRLSRFTIDHLDRVLNRLEQHSGNEDRAYRIGG